MANPLADLLAHQSVVILDGGLASTLESHGHDLDDPLWSARLLLEDPGAVAGVHREFLAAGADVITTATYQASLPGFAARGLDANEAAALIRKGVELAVAVRDAFWDDPANRTGRRRPLVAASVGPYGAYLADGSEYRGRYDAGTEVLKAFHAGRLEALASGGADLLACETMPSLVEIEVLAPLLDEYDLPAWFSFCCRDEDSLWDGAPVEEAARTALVSGRVAALGLNCTAPRHVAGLLERLRKVTDLPLVVYPNAGETYDPATRTWQPAADRSFPLAAAPAWVAAGARLVGGCCRVGPPAIAALRAALLT